MAKYNRKLLSIRHASVSVNCTARHLISTRSVSRSARQRSRIPPSRRLLFVQRSNAILTAAIHSKLRLAAMDITSVERMQSPTYRLQCSRESRSCTLTFTRKRTFKITVLISLYVVFTLDSMQLIVSIGLFQVNANYLVLYKKYVVTVRSFGRLPPNGDYPKMLLQVAERLRRQSVWALFAEVRASTQ